MITLKEVLANLKSVYGEANATVVNVDTISSVSMESYLLDLDAKLIATDGVLSAHKTEQYKDEKSGDYKLKSSVNVRKATWVAVASLLCVKDGNVIVSIALSIVGDRKYEDIADDNVTTIMRI